MCGSQPRNGEPGKCVSREGMAVRLDSLVIVFVSIYLLLNPFPHVTAIKQVAFYTSAAIALGLWAFKKQPLFVDTPLVRALLLFLAWAVITAPFAIDRGNTAHDIYAHFIRFVLVYMIVVTRFNTPRRLEFLARLLLFSCFAFICWAIYYYYFHLGYNFTRRFATGLRLGSFGTAIHVVGITAMFGTMLATLEIAGAKRASGRVFFLIAFAVCLAAVFLTQSRGIIVALFIFIAGFMALCRRRSAMAGVLVLLVLLVVLTPVRHRLSAKHLIKNVRFRIYATMAEVIKDYPLTGIGYGMESYRKLDADAYDRKITDESKKCRVGPDKRLFIADPHNWVIGVTARTGFVGLALYLSIVFSFFKMGFSLLNPDRFSDARKWGVFAVTSFAGLLAAGLFEPTFTSRIEVLYYSLFSMMTIAWRLNTKGFTV